MTSGDTGTAIIQRVESRAEELGLSMRTVLQRAGLKKSVWTEFKKRHAKNPSASMEVDNLAAIARVLGRSVDYFLGAPRRASIWVEISDDPRVSARSIMLGLQYPAAVIERVLAEPGERDVIYWVQRIALESGRPLPDELKTTGPSVVLTQERPKHLKRRKR